jgi:hypothetical protein
VPSSRPPRLLTLRPRFCSRDRLTRSHTAALGHADPHPPRDGCLERADRGDEPLGEEDQALRARLQELRQLPVTCPLALRSGAAPAAGLESQGTVKSAAAQEKGRCPSSQRQLRLEDPETIMDFPADLDILFTELVSAPDAIGCRGHALTLERYRVNTSPAVRPACRARLA